MLALQDAADAVPVALGVAAASALGLLAYTEVRTLDFNVFQVSIYFGSPNTFFIDFR